MIEIMCGIAGNRELHGLDEPAILARLAHRGPDGAGSVDIAPRSRLLRARLAISDLRLYDGGLVAEQFDGRYRAKRGWIVLGAIRAVARAKELRRNGIRRYEGGALRARR